MRTLSSFRRAVVTTAAFSGLFALYIVIAKPQLTWATELITATNANTAPVLVPSDQSEVVSMHRHPLSEESNRSPQTIELAQRACSMPKETPISPVFRDLTRIALYIWMPSKYRTAAECHNREDQCIEERGIFSDFPERRPEARQNMLKDYNALPAPLRPDNLVKLIRERVRDQFMPYVQREPDCHIPDPVLLQRTPEVFATDPTTLTIVVRLEIFEQMTPRIAVLSTHYYRPDSRRWSVNAQGFLGHMVPIPLDLPKDKISDLLTDFVKRLAVDADRDNNDTWSAHAK